MTWPQIEDRADYARYRAEVAERTKGYAAVSVPGDGPSTAFTWQPCFACGRALPGERYRLAMARELGRRPLHSEICPDCVYYLTYGKLDDETRSRIRDAKA